MIDQDDDFEKYIIRCNYLSDIKEYIKSLELPKCVNDQHKQEKKAQIEGYTSEFILSESKKFKTQYSLVFANAIAKSSKEIPNLFVELFDRVKNILS